MWIGLLTAGCLAAASLPVELPAARPRPDGRATLAVQNEPGTESQAEEAAAGDEQDADMPTGTEVPDRNPSAEPAGDVQQLVTDDLALTIPAAWRRSETTRNRLRIAEFVVPPPVVPEQANAGRDTPSGPEPAPAPSDTDRPEAASAEDVAEFVVVGRAGGTDEQNIPLWIGQFEEDPQRVVRMTQGESPNGKYLLVDIAGTYRKPVGNPVEQRTEAAPGYRLLVAVIRLEDGGNFYVKLVGPQDTVQIQAAAFRATFGGDAGQETPYSPQPAGDNEAPAAGDDAPQGDADTRG